jgi:hypothetical protein
MHSSLVCLRFTYTLQHHLPRVIALGNDAGQLVAFHDENGADALFGQQPDAIQDGCVGRNGVNPACLGFKKLRNGFHRPSFVPCNGHTGKIAQTGTATHPVFGCQLTHFQSCAVSICVGIFKEKKMGRILWAIGLFVALAGRALAVGSLADFTVYDRTERKNLPIQWHDGKAWVIGKPGRRRPAGGAVRGRRQRCHRRDRIGRAERLRH